MLNRGSCTAVIPTALGIAKDQPALILTLLLTVTPRGVPVAEQWLLYPGYTQGLGNCQRPTSTPLDATKNIRVSRHRATLDDRLTPGISAQVRIRTYYIVTPVAVFRPGAAQRAANCSQGVFRGQEARLKVLGTEGRVCCYAKGGPNARVCHYPHFSRTTSPICATSRPDIIWHFAVWVLCSTL